MSAFNFTFEYVKCSNCAIFSIKKNRGIFFSNAPTIATHEMQLRKQNVFIQLPGSIFL